MSKKTRKLAAPPKKKADFNTIIAQASAYHDNGKYQESIELYLEAIELLPTAPELHLNLGVAYFKFGKISDAVACFRQVTALAPHSSAAHSYLGTALHVLGEHSQAVEALQRAVGGNPKDIQSLVNLGLSLGALGRTDEAIAAYGQAVKLNPNIYEIHLNLGAALTAQGRFEEAVAAFNTCIALNPRSADAHSNLGVALRRSGRIDEALAALRQAVAINPNLANAHANLGVLLEKRGQPDEAMAYYAKAAELEPTSTNLSKILFNLNYCDTMPMERVAAEHFRVGGILDEQATPNRFPPRARGDRPRLRVGFVSPDFRNHSVSFFLKPLLRNFDRTRLEIFCYSDVAQSDQVTEELQGLVEHWLVAVGISDDQLAERIRSDEIDILIDLAGHGPSNRMPVFARRPSPVQVTWLGYANTTGLRSIDYRLVDGVSDPAEKADSYASETLLRLDDGFLCYEPPSYAPDPMSLAESAGSGITFGTFNNPSKITPATFDIWAKLLHRCDTSTLLIKHHFLQDETLRHHITTNFKERGIKNDRIVFLNGNVNPLDHLRTYAQVDIALDPILYNGTTTTCEALWMGVPVITLRGDRHAGRVGASLLSQIGLEALIAEDADGYIEKAVALANDRDGLAELRKGLRARMAASSLCDGPAFARKIERAFERMWKSAADERINDRQPPPLPLPVEPAKRSDAGFDAALASVVTLIATWTQVPNRTNLALLREARNRLVEALLEAPAATAVDQEKLAEVVEGVGQAGLKIGIEDGAELSLLASARRALTGSGDVMARGLLAHCLLTPAHRIPACPPISAIPVEWLKLAFAALSAEPIFWTTVDEPARHQLFVERLTRSCRDMLEALPPGSEKKNELALIFANGGRYTSTYFADVSLKALSRDRSRITEYCLTALGAPLDFQFGPSPRKRLRLGCFRKHWQSNTEAAAILAHLRGLDDRFEIILYSNQPLSGTPSEQAAVGMARHIRIVPENLATCVEVIRADDLDIFLIGHNITAVPSTPLFMAAYRLARFQVATSLCPSTTGLRNVDAFLNAEMNERPDAQDDYTEKLILAPGSINLYDFHEDTEEDSQVFTRNTLGVDDSSFLFVSGANSYKIGVELLLSWSRILERTKTSKLLLYPFNPHWRAIYPRQAFERHIRKIMALSDIDPERVELLPAQPDRAHIRSILRLANLYLDSFPFSGAVSILDPIEARLPMVLYRGEQARCRQSTGMHSDFALPALVADSPQEYEDLAVGLANAPDRLAALRQQAEPSLARIRNGRLRIADVLYLAFEGHEQSRRRRSAQG